MRLIDADALARTALTEACFNSHTEDVFLDLVDSMPTIEAEPVRHGRWVWYSSTMMKCSACGRTVPRHRYKGCPHCLAIMEPMSGAKMDGGGE